MIAKRGLRKLSKKTKESLINDLNKGALDLLYLSVWLSNQNPEREFQEFETKALWSAKKITSHTKRLNSILSDNTKKISLGLMSESLRIIVEAYLDPKNLEFFSEHGDYLDDFVRDHLEAISYENSKKFGKAAKGVSSQTNKRRNNKDTGRDEAQGPEKAFWINSKLVATHGGPQKFADTVLEYISGKSTASIERARHKYSRNWDSFEEPQISVVEIIKHLILSYPHLFSKIKPGLFDLMRSKNLSGRTFMHSPHDTSFALEELQQTLGSPRIAREPSL